MGTIFFIPDRMSSKVQGDSWGRGAEGDTQDGHGSTFDEPSPRVHGRSFSKGRNNRLSPEESTLFLVVVENKLERSSTTSRFSLVKYLEVRTVLAEQLSGVPLKGRLLALSANISLDWKGLSGINTILKLGSL